MGAHEGRDGAAVSETPSIWRSVRIGQACSLCKQAATFAAGIDVSTAHHLLVCRKCAERMVLCADTEPRQPRTKKQPSTGESE